MLKQLTDHVWVVPPAPDRTLVQPSVGVICTATQTVLFDAGNSPAHARQIMDGLNAIGAPPVAHIVYSHHHWDHIFGAYVYDVPVIAHEICRQAVVEYAHRPWGPGWLEQVSHNWPGLKSSFDRLGRLMESDWPDFRIVHPTVIYDQQTNTIPLDGVTLELEHVGGDHAADSTVLTVKEDGVMFLGDCFYPPVAYFQPGSKDMNLDMLSGLLDRGLGHYVDGHTGALSRSTWQNWVSLRR
jgi:glyoxylase-like metal-dependent hydrolase (beta-lactamase superfamily II)